MAGVFLEDLAGVFWDDFAGVFLTADFTGVFLELLAICFVFEPLLADGFEALFLVADLTGVDGWAAGVEATLLSVTVTAGFSALFAGVDIFLLDCLTADFLVAD